MKVLPSIQGRLIFRHEKPCRRKDGTPEFGVQFEPIFSKILELRAWYIQDEQCSFVFPLRNEIQKFVPVGYGKLQLVKRFLKRIFPKMLWITPQQWRKHVSSQYVGWWK